MTMTPIHKKQNIMQLLDEALIDEYGPVARLYNHNNKSSGHISDQKFLTKWLL
jgi:hypothetical protein